MQPRSSVFAQLMALLPGTADADSSNPERGVLSRMDRLGKAGDGGGEGDGPPPPGQGWRRFFTRKWMLLVSFTTLLLMAGAFVALFLYSRINPDQFQSLHDMGHSTVMFDQRGREVGPVGDMQREYITLEELEKYNAPLVNAFVAVEDKRFWSHNGVDPYSVARAAWANIRRLVTKESLQGAGTITMQVVRNFDGTREREYLRKAREAFRAVILEKQLPGDKQTVKRKILEAYMNIVSYSGRVQGVQIAAKAAFGVDLKRKALSPEQTAALVGGVQRPAKSGPFAPQPEKIKQRTDMVLDRLGEAGVYSAAEIAKAKAQPVQRASKETVAQVVTASAQYPAYKELVLKELAANYGLTSNDLRMGNYKIFTGLNTAVQEATDKALANPAYYKRAKNSSADPSTWDAASAAVDVKTGLVTAIGAGRHYTPGDAILGEGGNGRQQYGSTIKPLSVFGPAIEKSGGKINEYTTVPDEPITMEDGHVIQNADKRTYGDVPLGTAAGKSLNLATIWLLRNKVGLEDSYNTLERLGLRLEKADKNVSPLALGGLTHGHTMLRLATAYTVIPNQGRVVCSHFVDKVVGPDGQEVPPEKEVCEGADAADGSRKVFSPTTAWYLIRLLRPVTEESWGTAHGITLPNRQPFRAKTGTTDEGQTASMCMFTPRTVVCTLVFNGTGNKANNGIASRQGPGSMARDILSAAEQGKPVVPFEKPVGVNEPAGSISLTSLGVLATFQAGDPSIRITWQPQARGDTSEAANLKFRVTRIEGGARQVVANEVSGNSFTDRSITPGPTYTYLVEAFAPDGTQLPVREEVRVPTQEAAPSSLLDRFGDD